MPEQVYLTAEGRADLERELNELLTVRRPELARKLKEAVEQGDLKENADYHDAKEQQGFLEGRIQYLQNILRSATTVTDNGQSDVVRVGVEVTIVEEGGQEEETYRVVGPAEVNPRENPPRISHESPIGGALIGHKVGDKVRVKTPSGELVFKIKKIK